MYDDEKILETEFVVDDVTEAVVLIHQVQTDSLAAKDLHATVTLLRELRSRVSRLVADARDEETSWAEIGHILGTGRLWALTRYGPLWRRRRTPLGLD
jgi:hypothetical protein